MLYGAPIDGELFFSRIAEDLPSLDLLIVAGTSLVVAPANSVVYEVPDACVRLIVNREQVGGEVYGERPTPDVNPNPALRPAPTQVGAELTLPLDLPLPRWARSWAWCTARVLMAMRCSVTSSAS